MMKKGKSFSSQNLVIEISKIEFKSKFIVCHRVCVEMITFTFQNSQKFYDIGFSK